MNRDNQQETVTEAEFGWLAGIIDGEGSMSINRLLRSTTNYNGRVQIPNTNEAIIAKTRSIFDRLGVTGHTEKRQPPPEKKNKWKTAYVITLNSAGQIALLLPKIIPYLVGKKDHAEILLTFVQSRLDRQKDRKQTIIFDERGKIASSTRKDTYNEMEIALYSKLCALNKKGTTTDSSTT